MLVLSEHVAMTGVAMTFRYQEFMIRRQTFCEVGVTLGRLFQAPPYGLPLHVTWDNWKNVFLLGRTTASISWQALSDKS